MTAQQRLTPHHPVPARFTAEEFMALCQHPPISDWVGKVELVEGEIVRMSPPHLPHWNVQRIIHLLLLDLFRAVGPEWVVGVEAAVKLSTDTLRIADIAVLRTPDLTRQGALERDDLFLAVEIADSTLRNDLGVKLRDYAAAAVPHYWVVDIKKRETHVMSAPDGTAYTERRRIAHGEPIAVPGTDAVITLA